MPKGLFGLKLFDFSTAEQKKNEELQYKAKMFPLGDEQIAYEDHIYKELFSSRKDLPGIRYMGLIRRENLIDGDGYDDYKDYLKAAKKMKVTDEELSIIEALAILENRAMDLEMLPSKEEILEKAKTIEIMREPK